MLVILPRPRAARRVSRTLLRRLSASAASASGLLLASMLGVASPAAHATISVIGATTAAGCSSQQTLNSFGSLSFDCGSSAPGTAASIDLAYTGAATAATSDYSYVKATLDYTVKVVGPGGATPTIDIPLVLSGSGSAYGINSQSSIFVTFQDKSFVAGQSASCIVSGCFVHSWALFDIGVTLNPGDYLKVNEQLGAAGYGTSSSSPGQTFTGTSGGVLAPLTFGFMPGFDSTGYQIVVSDGIGVAPVPEPATGALLLAGGAIVGWSVRRRRLAA